MINLPQKARKGPRVRRGVVSAANTAWRQLLLCGLLVFIVPALASGVGQASDAEDSFRLGTGDKLRITVFQEPDLTGEYSVGSNGTVSMPLVGNVGASGLTTRELERAIVEALENGLMRDPKVSIEVLEARPFYILGDVTAPGSYPFVSGMTVLNAIALAGGNLANEQDEVEARLALVRDQERLALLIKDYRSAIAFEARLLAQRDGAEEIAFPAELMATRTDPEAQAIMNGERRVFQSEKELLASRIELLTEKGERIEEQIAAYNAQIGAVREQVDLINAQLKDQNVLFEKGLARSTQVADLKRDIAEAKIARAKLLVDIAGARQQLSESRLGMVEVRNEALRTAMIGLQEVQKEISRLRTSIQTAREEVRQDRLKLGRAQALLASEQTHKVVITRREGNKVVEIEANDETAVAPGDILRVFLDVEAPITMSALIAPDRPVDFQGEEALPIPMSEISPLNLATELDRPDPEPTAPVARLPAPDPQPATVANAEPEIMAAPEPPEFSTETETEAAADPAGREAVRTQQSEEEAQPAAEPTQADAAVAVAEAAGADGGAATSDTMASEAVAPEGGVPAPEVADGAETETEEPPVQTAAAQWAQLVTDVQSTLKTLGYGETPRIVVDGIMGPRTKAAIASFQTNHGLEADGQPSEPLRDRLAALAVELDGAPDPRIAEAAAEAMAAQNEDDADEPLTPAPAGPRVQTATPEPRPEPTPEPAPEALTPQAGTEGDEPEVATIATRTIWLEDSRLGMDKGLVQRIQERLIELGYAEEEAITPDDTLGPPTRVAIARYQQDHGLPEDGQPSIQLLNHMDNEFGQRPAGGTAFSGNDR